VGALRENKTLQTVGKASADCAEEILMNVINDVILAVIGLMNEQQPFAQVTRGALPTKPSITCEIAPSTPDRVFMDKERSVPLDCTINAKHSDLETVTTDLNRIFDALTALTDYPSGDGWKIYDISTGTLPQIIGREDNGEWLLAGSLIVKIYWA
jgi:hypothetical protein